MSKPGSNQVDCEIRSDGIAIVTLDHYPVNTLTNAVQIGIEDAAEKIAQNKQVIGVVVRGAGKRAFCAGADIQDLNRKHKRYPKKPFMEYFEELNVPVVAAIQGFALGGGLELCLGCHYRVMAKNAFIGLPEVNIGLLPGGQGTQRLPRLIGAKAAMDLMCSGGHVPAKHAEKFKVADLVVEHKDLLEKSIQFAKDMASKNPNNTGRKIRELPAPKGDEELFKKSISMMKAKRRGEPAPLKIIECVRAACNEPTFEAGVKVENKLFLELLGGREANALQHVFFSERACAKVPGVTEKPARLSKIGIIGAGLMGGGIGMCFANVGIQVVFIDREQKFLDKGISVIKGHYARSVKRGSKTQAQVDKALSMMSGSTEYGALADVDLVIEAVFEDMQLKKEIFAKLDKVCKPGCILASNTSFLSIDEIASATKRPEDVIGMHFFSPANVMKLLENVRGEKSSHRTIATAMHAGAIISKVSVLVGNCHGFVGNRMMKNYGEEARAMMNEGADIEVVDNVATKFGMPMGPFQMTDLTGTTIGFEARKKQGLVFPDKNVQDWIVENGRFGMKNGKGFYDYSKDRKRTKNPQVMQQIDIVRKNLGITPRNVSNEEIFARLIYPIINEGFKILEEGFASRPSDIDVVLCHGYNWPRPTGGPMWYGETMDGGLPKLLQTLRELETKFPKTACYKPSQLLVDCVNAGTTLTKYWAKNAAKYDRNAKNSSKL